MILALLVTLTGVGIALAWIGLAIWFGSKEIKK